MGTDSVTHIFYVFANKAELGKSQRLHDVYSVWKLSYCQAIHVCVEDFKRGTFLSASFVIRKQDELGTSVNHINNRQVLRLHDGK